MEEELQLQIPSDRGSFAVFLVEREEVVEELNSIIADTFSGNGVVAVIGGSTATGKTTLLRDLNEKARAAGATIFNAMCSRDEQSLPYGMLGQLLTLNERRSDRAGIARDTHRTAAELVRNGPVLIIVDDVQFADEESLHCLRYLARRMMFSPLSIVVTWDAGLNHTPLPAVEAFIYGSSVRRIHLKPLTREGVGRLLAAERGSGEGIGSPADLYRLSRGNPLIIKALLDDRDRLGRPDADEIVVGSAYQQAVVTCVRNVGPLAVRVARGIAVLGDTADVQLLSRLADVHTATTQRGIEVLTGLGILDGREFRHPAGRACVLDDIPVGEHGALRSKAAQLLYDDGAPATAVADQLVAVDPIRHEWALPVLRQAAQQAQSSHDLTRAITYLKLARDCCADEVTQNEIKVQLTQLHWLQEPGNSSDRFLTLKAPILAGKIGVRSALTSAAALLWNLRMEDALEVIGHVDATAGVDEELRTTELLMSSIYPGVYARLTRRRAPQAATGPLRPGTGSAGLRIAESLSAVLRNTVDEHTIVRIEQTLQDEGLTSGPIGTAAPALLGLVYADRLESADAWCDRLMTEANRRGAPAGRLMLLGFRSMISYRQGHLKAAAERASAALRQMPGQDWNVSVGHAINSLVQASTSMGNHEVAAECLARPVPRALFHTLAGLHYLHARGRHYLATGHPHAAQADFMACGELMREWDMDIPSLVPWRLGATEALLGVGEREWATALAEEEFRRADLFSGTSYGMTLRTLAMVRAPHERPALLEKAFSVLQLSGSHYEAALALADLSRAISGDKAKARVIARRAWRMAKNCHADELCQSLMPKHPAATRALPAPAADDAGNDALFGRLSSSESRVAVLAAQGYSNREIGDRLFVTVSTVEQHLTRIYRKLNIRNRDQLPTELRLAAATSA
ncbi:AAA family ATPase [Streptomyces sp. SL13]|uniref:AAA family ATPase n=1 Tax=Streptantibioticus silvisoli TaxID=2705255 RepID=A0AA90GWV7_9ACTN|nr:LuxR family transcriptional regulator [Streptantibioticus silvisoli]MDI5967911.1 AAA family ATPase [Streptantibioticus silvisoli]